MKIAGGLMVVAALWNLLFAAMWVIAWIGGIWSCCLAVVPLLAAAHACRNGWHGVRLMRGERVPDVTLTPGLDLIISLVALCGFGATMPNLVALVLLSSQRPWIDGRESGRVPGIE
ncbi:MAG: hypothetical protein ACI8PZ_005160 [Myxococcota bacterium]